MPYPEVLVSRWRRVIGRRAGTVSSSAAVGVTEHPATRELREPLLQGVVEPEPPGLHKAQRGDRGDRLGHRLDSHDRVALHGLLPRSAASAGRQHLGIVDAR